MGPYWGRLYGILSSRNRTCSLALAEKHARWRYAVILRSYQHISYDVYKSTLEGRARYLARSLRLTYLGNEFQCISKQAFCTPGCEQCRNFGPYQRFVPIASGVYAQPKPSCWLLEWATGRLRWILNELRLKAFLCSSKP